MANVAGADCSTESPATLYFTWLPATRTQWGNALLPRKLRIRLSCRHAQRGSPSNKIALLENIRTVMISLMIVYKIYQFLLVHFKFTGQLVMCLVSFGRNITISDAKGANGFHVYELAPSQRDVLDSLIPHIKSISKSCPSISITFLRTCLCASSQSTTQ